MFENDYILRLIHEMIRALIKLALNIDTDEKDPLILPDVFENDEFKRIMDLVDDGKINEAENLLLDEMDPDNPAYFELGLLFYEKLGAQTEEFLESHNYTQDEVVEGLKYFVDCYGYGDLWDTISR